MSIKRSVVVVAWIGSDPIHVRINGKYVSAVHGECFTETFAVRCELLTRTRVDEYLHSVVVTAPGTPSKEVYACLNSNAFHSTWELIVPKCERVLLHMGIPSSN